MIKTSLKEYSNMEDGVLYNLGLTPKLQEEEKVDFSLYHPRQRTNIRLYGLECKDWTPLMVMEYKKKWAPTGTPVLVYDDYDGALNWCRKHLYHHTFNATKWANPDDSHTVHFEKPEDAMLFKLSFYG